MIIDCAHYVAGVRQIDPISIGDAASLARDGSGFVWLASSDPGPDELRELRDVHWLRLMYAYPSCFTDDMIKTIAGIHQPDGGQIYWDGRPVHIRTPRDAAALGIQTVYQDLALCDNLDIVQNMFLGRERTKADLLDENSMETSATETLAGLSVTTVRSIRQPVASLSGGQRQAVAIARAVLWNSGLVIRDEPTAALGVTQTAMVLDLVRGLADRGLAVLLISHNLIDVFKVADRLAVLRLGRMVATGRVSEFDPQRVVDYMTFGRTDTPRDADSTTAQPRD